MKLKTIPSTSFLAEEPRTLVVSKKTKAHWAVLIDLIVEFDRVCRENGLRYFAEGGTLLGTVRHCGFIPWDDDVDVAMPRSDYERLGDIAQEVFKSPYFFQTNGTDPEWTNLYGRLCNSETTAISKEYMKNGKTKLKGCRGIFIDIFPLDKLPDNLQEREAFLNQIVKVDRKRWKRAQARRLYQCPKRQILVQPLLALQYLYGAWLAFLQRFLKLDLVQSAHRKVHHIAQRYNGMACHDCAELAFVPDSCRKVFWPVSFFKSLKYMPFEYIEISVPSEPEKFLVIAFGDWREHVIGASMHGDMFIDVNHSYKEYQTL